MTSGYTSAAPPGAGGPKPGSTGPSVRLAGWWRRAGAAVLDGLLIGAAAGLLLALFLSVADESLGVLLSLLVWVPCAMIAAALYAPVLMTRTGGRTLGRMVAGTRVVRAGGASMTFGRAVLREVVVKWGLFYGLGGVLTLGIVPLVDVLWPLWDEQKRALHDLVVGTRTIRA